MPRFPRRRNRSEGPASSSPDELVRENRRLRKENARLRDQNTRLRSRIDRLESLVEELRRAAKRQAAPFSRNNPKRRPARPGRRAGEAYGTKARRAIPDHVDEQVEVPLPKRCPDCAGVVALERIAVQFCEELPEPRPHVIRFDVAIGRCTRCGRRVQPRHPRQASDALGAAQTSLGPRAVAVAAQLGKELGIPHAKVAAVLRTLAGIEVTPGGLAAAMHRAAQAAEPTYDAICDGVAASAVVAPDETGWRVGGAKAWLHAFVGDGVTAYEVAKGRGYEEAAAILGEGFSGVLERDGWAPYRRFADATHQSCIAHLLRRCNEMIEAADRGQARVPHALRRILADALAARDAYREGRLTRRGLDRKITALERRIDRLLAGHVRHAPNVRLLRHLANEAPHLFTFLEVEGVEATNWRAEHAIRPAVVARKVSGGNRTWRGAHTFEVLASVLRTCR